ncbi:MAG TPA: hypothetical protein VKE73_03475 [Myxococcota bacterium]|nr:hypothetical protein [Myxococcota bacterium]
MSSAATLRPEQLMRHRPPALLLGTVVESTPSVLVCEGIDDGPWRWARLLEGAAQAAGLFSGLQPGGPGVAAVIGEYRDVAIHAARHEGQVRFHAALDRRILGFWRCRVEARGADGRLLLSGLVAVAPGVRP